MAVEFDVDVAQLAPGRLDADGAAIHEQPGLHQHTVDEERVFLTEP